MMKAAARAVMALALLAGGTSFGQTTASLHRTDQFPGIYLGQSLVTSMKVYTSPVGTHLYFAGGFRFASSEEVWGLVRWDGQNFEGVGPNQLVVPINYPENRISMWPTGLEVFDDGDGPKLYYGGEFDILAKQPRVEEPLYNCIAKFDGTAWSSVGFGTSGKIEGHTLRPNVQDLCVHDDGNGPALIAVGNFRYMDLQLSNGVAMRRNGVWSGVGATISPFTVVYPNNCLSFDEDGPGPEAAKLFVFDHNTGMFAWDGQVWTQKPSVPLTWNRRFTVEDEDGSGAQLPKIFGLGADQTKVGVYDGETWSIMPQIITDRLSGVGGITTGDDGTGWALYNGTWRWRPGATAWESSVTYPTTECDQLLVVQTVNVADFVDPDGAGPLGNELWLAGALQTFNDLNLNGVARHSATGWKTAPEGTGWNSASRSVWHDGSASVPAGLVSSPSVRAGTTHATSATLWQYDGIDWSPIGDGFVAADCANDPGSLYFSAPVMVDGEAVFGARRFTGGAWVVDAFPGVPTSQAVQHRAGDDRYVVAGSFTIDGQPTKLAQRVGGVWSALPAIPNGLQVPEIPEVDVEELTVYATPTMVLARHHTVVYATGETTWETRILKLTETGWDVVAHELPHTLYIRGLGMIVTENNVYVTRSSIDPNFVPELLVYDGVALSPFGVNIPSPLPSSMAEVQVNGLTYLVATNGTNFVYVYHPEEDWSVLGNVFNHNVLSVYPFKSVPGGFYITGQFSRVDDVRAGNYALMKIDSVITCAPDFNNSGTVTVQDIFDFLSAWFAGTPSADFNSSGGVTVQDIFDFLGAWFAGC